MKNEKLDLDSIMNSVVWPEAGDGLKRKILATCDEDLSIKTKRSVRNFNKAAVLSVAVVFSFVLGSATNFNSDGNYNVTSYFYTGTGTVMASGIFN